MPVHHTPWPNRALRATAVLAACLPSAASAAPAVIPRPVEMQVNEGRFTFFERTRVIAEGEAAAEARKLVESLEPAFGRRLEFEDGPADRPDSIHLRIDRRLQRELGPEGYRLHVTPERIDMAAAQPAGLFYAGQTLRQLLPPAVYSGEPVEGVEWSVPCVEITDYPRFGWRGLLIDPARHFIPVEDVKRFIDLMAVHKFNRLQIHLNDDQGWRIEINKYPRLTEVGSRREETLVGHSRQQPHEFDGQPHGGFYAQDDIRHLVRYAAERYVTIVPEISMPGHSQAAIVAYPELGVFPEKQRDLQVWTRWGISEHILAPRPRTIEFCKDAAHREYMAYPRVCAMAEVLWSAEKDPFDAFLLRLESHLERLRVAEVNFRPLDEPSPRARASRLVPFPKEIFLGEGAFPVTPAVRLELSRPAKMVLVPMLIREFEKAGTTPTFSFSPLNTRAKMFRITLDKPGGGLPEFTFRPDATEEDYILKHDNYAHLRETGNIVCPVKDESYQLLDDLYSEVCPLLPFPMFNVCCDETFGLGTGPSKELAGKIGVGGVYVEDIRRVHRLLKARRWPRCSCTWACPSRRRHRRRPLVASNPRNPPHPSTGVRCFRAAARVRPQRARHPRPLAAVVRPPGRRPDFRPFPAAHPRAEAFRRTVR